MKMRESRLGCGDLECWGSHANLVLGASRVRVLFGDGPLMLRQSRWKERDQEEILWRGGGKEPAKGNL